MAMRPAIIVPALDAAETIAKVVSDLRAELGADVPIIVVDDGSTDDTARVAEGAGARVVRHDSNRGKGAAIRTGFVAALESGCDVGVTVDADGQHPAGEAARLLEANDDPEALVLGTRQIGRSGAPRANVIGNRFSNFFVSLFTWRRFRDTQCGLRRYPIARTLSLRTKDQRFGFEAEILFMAVRGGLAVIEAPVVVLYPPRGQRTTRYRAFKDTFLVIHRIAVTVFFPVRWVLLALCTVTVAALVHPGIVLATRMLPPPITISHEAATIDARDPDLRRVGPDYARHRGKILEVALSG
jgi:glycosyltransferase involved in cell wall biosynthesis